jgi:hypothetical protein
MLTSNNSVQTLNNKTINNSSVSNIKLTDNKILTSLNNNINFPDTSDNVVT